MTAVEDEHARATLRRLQEQWKETHRITCTGRLWIATAHDPNAPWRTEIEDTPDQLEARLRREDPTVRVPTPR